MDVAWWEEGSIERRGLRWGESAGGRQGGEAWGRSEKEGGERSWYVRGGQKMLGGKDVVGRHK